MNSTSTSINVFFALYARISFTFEENKDQPAPSVRCNGLVQGSPEIESFEQQRQPIPAHTLPESLPRWEKLTENSSRRQRYEAHDGATFSHAILVFQKAAGGKAKKPLSGFMLFSKENRPKVKEENPDISFGQLGKKLGEMWRALSDKEKQEFKDRKG